MPDKKPSEFELRTTFEDSDIVPFVRVTAATSAESQITWSNLRINVRAVVTAGDGIIYDQNTGEITADITNIADLPAATTLAGTEVVPGVQASGTVKITVQQIANLVSGAAAAAPVGAYYITTQSDGTLTNDKVLTVGKNIAVSIATSAVVIDVIGNSSSNNVTASTSISVSSAYNGQTLYFTASTTVSIHLVSDAPNGMFVGWNQNGTGQLFFVAAAGATMNNRSSHTRSAGRYAMGSLVVGPSNGVWTLTGDTAS